MRRVCRRPSSALEGLIDDLAAELEMERFAFRYKNAAKPGDLMISEQPWPKMAMTQVLEKMQEHPVWQNREAARAAGRGVGFAVGGWPGGTGPASAACKLERDGTLQLDLGSVDISGTNTGFALDGRRKSLACSTDKD